MKSIASVRGFGLFSLVLTTLFLSLSASIAHADECARWRPAEGRRPVQLRADVQGAELAVDGRRYAADCGLLHLEPGEHEFSVRHARASGVVTHRVAAAAEPSTQLDFRLQPDTHTEVLPRVAAVGAALMLLSGGNLITLSLALDERDLLLPGALVGTLGAGMLAGGIAGWNALDDDFDTVSPAPGGELQRTTVRFEEPSAWHSILLPLMVVGGATSLAGLIPIGLAASAAERTAAERDGQRKQMAVGASLTSFGGALLIGSIVGYVVADGAHDTGTLRPRITPSVSPEHASVTLQMRF